MIQLTYGVRIFVATDPMDFRKDHDGLAAVVQSHLKRHPFDGAIYVFRANRADWLKLIYWDGSGLVTKHDRNALAVVERMIHHSATAAPSLVVSLALSTPLVATGIRCACQSHASQNLSAVQRSDDRRSGHIVGPARSCPRKGYPHQLAPRALCVA